MHLKFLLRLTIAFLFASLLFLTSESAQAHPGRTDDSGGHTCRTNCDRWGVGYGEYHYHNGGSRGLDLKTRLEILRAETCLEHKKNLEEKKYTLIEVDDYCLTPTGLENKEQLILERDRQLEEDRLLRLKKEREGRISNWVTFFTFLYIVYMFSLKNNYIYRPLLSKIYKSGVWLIFPLIVYLNNAFPSSIDWNGINNLRLSFFILSTVFIFRYFEDTSNLFNKIIKFRKIIFEKIKHTYKSTNYIIRRTINSKLFMIIKNVFLLPVDISFKIISIILLFVINSFLYGFVGALIFGLIEIVIREILSIDFEIFVGNLFVSADVEGLNDISSFLFTSGGFLSGIVFFIYKKRREIFNEYRNYFSKNLFL